MQNITTEEQTINDLVKQKNGSQRVRTEDYLKLSHGGPSWKQAYGASIKTNASETEVCSIVMQLKWKP